MKLNGVPFVNSNTCKGLVFAASSAPLDMAEIVISGRYPESGWARNLESHEIVRVLRGTGNLTLRDGGAKDLAEGDAVHVPPKTWFAWSGDMTILMACSPAFNPGQYEIEEGI